MRASTSKDGDLLSLSDKIDEPPTENINTSLKHLLVNNHYLAANKTKIKGQLPLEHIFGYYKTFEKNNKRLGFQLTFKTADLKDIFIQL